MRVLHLTPELPAASGWSGGATRQFHLLRRLRELGHTIDIVAPVSAAQAGLPGELRAAGLGVVAIPRPDSRMTEVARAALRDLRLAPAVATRPLLTWQADVFHASLRRPIARALAERPPDVVHVEHDIAAGWVPPAVARRIPAVLSVDNVSWRYYATRAAAARAGGRHLAAAGAAIEARRFRRHDLRLLDRYRTLVAMSEVERAALGPYHRDVAVVPNGVVIPERVAAPPAADGPTTLLFTGTMTHPPNDEGVRWFVREIWPRIAARRPETRFVIAGRGPSPGLVRLAAADERIEVTGAVASMAPQFARATVVVAPLQSGGGTRLKVLEALAARRAIVATPVAAEGLELADGAELLLARDPAGFAAATLRLLDDASERERIAGTGRRAVEQRYDWAGLGDRLAGVFERAAADGGDGGRAQPPLAAQPAR